MHSVRFSSSLGLLLFITACVTMNVYFPTAEAADAADRIIRDVYDEGKPAKPAAPQASPAPDSLSALPVGRSLLVAVLEWLVTPAQADANIDISSPAIQAIRASLESRFASLKPFYENGSVGMTADGLITVRDLNAVPLRERKTVSSLVEAENRDRNALYKEIARANGHPEWESDIRSTFAQRWVANAPGGWWYQQGGAWKQK
jgi:uncharacterized protein YdbL (DUF1318 family)